MCTDTIKDLSDETTAWVETVVPILQTIKQNGSEGSGLDMIQGHFRVPGDAQTYAKILVMLYDKLDAPNEYEYILRPAKEVETHDFRNLFDTWVEGRDDLSSDFTKAVYLMLHVEERWPWRHLIEWVNRRIQGLYSNSGGIHEIGQGEYAGLIGALLILASRGQRRKSTETLEAMKDDERLYLALHLSRKDAASTAACALALLFAEDGADEASEISLDQQRRSYQRKNTPLLPEQQTPLRLRNNSEGKRPNTPEKGVSKGRGLLGKIVGQPSSYSKVIHHMRTLLKQCNLAFDDPRLSTHRDLSFLKE